jgi:hypothetical protein
MTDEEYEELRKQCIKIIYRIQKIFDEELESYSTSNAFCIFMETIRCFLIANIDYSLSGANMDDKQNMMNELSNSVKKGLIDINMKKFN